MSKASSNPAPINYAAAAKARTQPATASAESSRGSSPVITGPSGVPVTAASALSAIKDASTRTGNKLPANASFSTAFPNPPADSVDKVATKAGTTSYSSAMVSKDPGAETKIDPASMPAAKPVTNGASSVASIPAVAKDAVKPASKETSTPMSIPKFDINSFFQAPPQPPSPEQPNPPPVSTPSDSQGSRRPASTYDPTTSPRPANALPPSASFQSSLTAGSRSFSPVTPGMSPSPQFAPHGQPYGNQFHPDQHAQQHRQQSYGGGSAPNRQNGPAMNRMGSVSGPAGRYGPNGPTSPHMANGQLPNQSGQPQGNYWAQYPQQGSGNNWQQPPYGANHPYGGYPGFYPGQQQYMGGPPTSLSASASSPALARSPSNGPSISPSPSSSTLMASTASNSNWKPPSADSSGVNSPAPSTPATSHASLPPSASTTPFRPGAASFNPSASEFSPSAPPRDFQYAPKRAAIVIRKPPAAPVSSKDKVSGSAAEDTKKAAAEKAKADEEQAAKEKAEKDAADQKLKQEAEAKAKAKAEEERKAAEEAKAKAEAEAKAKAEAEAAEKAAKDKAEQEQKLKEEEARAKAEQDAREAAEKKEAAEKEVAAAKAREEANLQADEAKKASEAKASETPENKLLSAVKSTDVSADAGISSLSTSPSSTRAPTPEPLTPVDSPLLEEIPEDDEEKKRKASPPEPLNLKVHARTLSTDSRPVSNQALKTAQSITDLKSVVYPEEISSPRPDLNAEAAPGRFRYDRDFLLQFMAICRERPEQLPSLEAIGMSDAEGTSWTPAAGSVPGTPRGGAFNAGSRRASTQNVPGRGGMMGPPQRMPSQQFAQMGQFAAMPANKLSSSERYQQSLMQPSIGQAFAGGRPGGLSRAPSAGPMAAMGRDRDGRRSQRGSRRTDHARNTSQSQPMAGEYVAPLETTENAWVPTVASAKPQQVDVNSPENVQRKVKALLNKLTLEKFDSISKQILEWANKSEHETDGRILRQVIALIFEKATDEAQWSEMYAKLCRMLQELLNPNIKDASLGEGTVGGSLFRKYLLNRCQEDYERGWQQREEATKAAASKAGDDNAKKAAAEKEAEAGATENKEAELMSDEYYIAQKAKRRGLGLVRFIGELYKLNMLTARIMRECIQKLLTNVDDPEEEDMESVCRLLTTVGKQLEEDNPSKSDAGLAKSRGLMSVYIDRLQKVRTNPKVPSRIQFMVQDVIELKKAGWRGKQADAGPKTIAQVHQDAKQADIDAARRVASSGGRLPTLNQQLGKAPSRRGQSREQGADGWSSVPAAPRQAGDLKGFGTVRAPSSSGSARSLGSGRSVFNQNRGAQQREEPAAEAPRGNMFSALQDATPDGSADASSSERPKLQLLARTKPVEGEEGEEAKAEEEEDEEVEDEEVDEEPAMDEAAIERSIKNSVTEFFSIKSIEEGVETFKALPIAARPRLVKAMTTAALDKKEAEVKVTALLYTAVHEQDLVSSEAMLEGLEPMVIDLDDLSTDVPKAYTFAGILLKGAGLTEEQVRTLSEKMEAEEVEEAQERLMSAFLSRS